MGSFGHKGPPRREQELNIGTEWNQITWTNKKYISNEQQSNRASKFAGDGGGISGDWDGISEDGD